MVHPLSPSAVIATATHQRRRSISRSCPASSSSPLASVGSADAHVSVPKVCGAFQSSSGARVCAHAPPHNVVNKRRGQRADGGRLHGPRTVH